MLHNAGIDLETAEKMPMHYALAFLSEKMNAFQKAKPRLENERQQNTHTGSSSSTKTYVSTKRVCQ